MASVLASTDGQQGLQEVSGGVTLNGLVERLVVFLDELPPPVEQVDLTPGDHDPGEGLLIRASTLHGFVKFVSKEERLVLDTLNNGHKHVHGVAELDMTERLSLSFIDVAHESMDCPLSLSLNPSDYSTLVL